MNFWKKLKADCAALNLDCREAVRAQSEAMDRPLPLARRIGLRLHLVICLWCRRYGRQLRLLHQAAHDHAEQINGAAPGELPVAARERIKERLRGEG